MAEEKSPTKTVAKTKRVRIGGKSPAEAAKAAGPKLAIKVFSPYHTFYEGPGISVSAANKTGPFDVLLNHSNFFSLLSAGEVVVDTGYKVFRFPINRGIIQVKNNQVTVYVGV